LQREVAQSVETVYPDDANYIPVLAHHWVEADMPEKAADYLERAGAQMYLWSHDKSAQYIEKAMTYDNRINTLSTDRYLLRYSMLGMAHYGMGNTDTAIAHFQDFLKHFGSASIPQQSWQIVPAILREVSKQYRIRRNPQRYVGQKVIPQFDDKMYGALINLPAAYIYKGDALRALLTTFMSLNTIEALKPTPENSPSLFYGAVTLLTGMVGLRGIARHYAQLTEKAAQNASVPLAAQSKAVLGMYAFQNAEWDAAETNVSNVISLFDGVGELHSRTEMQHMTGMILMHRGRYADALAITRAAYETASERRDSTLQLNCLFLLGLLLRRMGRMTEFDDFHLLIDEAAGRSVFEKAFAENKVNEIVYILARTISDAQAEMYRLAFEGLRRCMGMLKKEQLQRTTQAFDLYAELAGVCHMLLTRGHTDFTAEEITEVLSYFEKVVKTLSQYAKVYVFAQPRTLLYRGWLAYHKHNPKAQQYWQDTLQRAQTLKMPFEEAIAHAALVQGAKLAPDEREQQANSALTLFKQIGVSEQFGQEHLEINSTQEQS
jgi:tetratricopeptide (TPR) repeat protein